MNRHHKCPAWVAAFALGPFLFVSGHGESGLAAGQAAPATSADRAVQHDEHALPADFDQPIRL
jgi:hypothetical protein